MRLLLAALLLSACASYTSGPESTTDGPPIGGTGTDGGDGGLDGGDGGLDGGDGGQDAGCTALALNTTTIFDDCFLHTAVPGSVSVNTTSCTVNINAGTTICTGTVAGANNAFNGGCNSIPCTSASLPGTVLCITGPSSSCNIIVDGGP